MPKVIRPSRGAGGWLVAFWLTAGVPSVVMAGEPLALSIDDAVARALQDSPGVRLATATASARKEEVSAARRAAGPTLDAEFSALRGHGEPTTFNAVNGASDPDNPRPLDTITGNYGSTRLDFSAPIYQNGALFFQKAPDQQFAEGSYGRAQAEGQGQAAESANRTAKAYLGSLSQAAVVSLQQRAQERLSERLQYISERVRARVAAQADLLSAEAALAGKVADVKAAQRQYALQQLQLATSMGLARDQQVSLTPVPDTLPVLPPIEGMIENALATHPSLISQTAKIGMAQAQLDVTRGQRLPKVSLEASAIEAGNFEDSGRRDFGSIGFKVSMPLFDSGQSRARLRANRFQVEEAEQNLALTRDSMIQASYVSYYAYLDAVDRIGALEKLREKAQYQEGVSRARFETRVIGLDLLLTDEAGLLSAEIDLDKSRYIAWSAYADFLLSLGRPFASAPDRASGAPSP